MEKPNYISPEIEIIDVAIEKGFAQSQQLEDIDREDSIGW